MISHELMTSALPAISPREKEVLYLIAFERTSKEIAHELHISTETVHSHRQNIMYKMGVRNVAGMVRVGMEKRIISVSTAKTDNYKSQRILEELIF